MQNKKRKLIKWLAAAVVFILICPCFLSAGSTSAYISDLSNTCENVFIGVTESETQPTQDHEKPQETTTYKDTGSVSPPTGEESIGLFVVAACALFIGMLVLISPKRNQ